MDIQFLKNHWYADIYEQQVTQSDEVEFILEMVERQPKKILEVACGDGRILIPLGKLGHMVTGFDFDEFMLEKCRTKAETMHNVTCYKADAVTDDWGSGFDIVVLAGNILLNIESEMDYMQSQKLFIKKAFDCLHQGGYLYLDMDNYTALKSYSNGPERLIFEGTDDLGTYGRYSLYDTNYDNQTQITSFTRKTVITTKDGDKQIFEKRSSKHFPKIHQVIGWLTEVGFEITKTFGDYRKNPLTNESRRMIIWVKKV